MENQISIPDKKKEWVRQQIQAGHYPNEEAYIEDLINRDQLYQTKKAALIDALKKGEESGVSSRTVKDIIQDTKAKLENGEI